MKEKYFNRNILYLIIYIISIIFFLTGIILLIITLNLKIWQMAGFSLLVLSCGLMGFLFLFNKSNDVIINYDNKEIISNIRFDFKNNICVPFDSIVNVYIYNKEQLKQEVKMKKYPKQTLVVERKFYKQFIPLNWFSKKNIDSLLEELLKVRDSNESID